MPPHPSPPSLSPPHRSHPILLLALLLATAEPRAANAAPVRAALQEAGAALDRIDQCLVANPSVAGRYQPLFARYRQLTTEAESLFGIAYESKEARALGCSPAALLRYSHDADRSIARADARLAHTRPRQPGLWIGTMRVCRALVVDVTVGPSEFEPHDRPVVTLKFVPAAREQLARLTAARVGQPLAVRIDGRLITAPVVNEPILGGQIQLSGGADGDEWETIRSAALRPC